MNRKKKKKEKILDIYNSPQYLLGFFNKANQSFLNAGEEAGLLIFTRVRCCDHTTLAGQFKSNTL